MKMNSLDVTIGDALKEISALNDVKELVRNASFRHLLEILRNVDAFSHELNSLLPQQLSTQSTGLLRRLKTAYALPLRQLLQLLLQLAQEMAADYTANMQRLAKLANEHDDGNTNISKLLLKYADDTREVKALLSRLETEDPHAIYPTSPYRSSKGTVSSTKNGNYIEAVMTTATMTEIHITEGVLQHDNHILRNLYKPLGKCVCVLDTNVSEHFGDDLKGYFEYHNIPLELLVYRAMEVDKGIHTVEALLGDFKRIGVSRQEPVLIVGGGVIADIGGLACSLYHRNTPYVMLATSIVSGIDAGPSPRTCCDGFGFKNLFGAYHAPVLTLTDRTFFKTLRTGWIRHGIAEIIKMAVVKDVELFELLESTGVDLIHTQFGTVTDDQRLKDNGQHVLALAMKSYVEAEYGNLYETHQCRPHAYGHTWSPGFEIPSGMLHGHAVACGMGFGAFLSHEQGWISTDDRDRILRLISDFELSLWHPILNDTQLIYKAQVKVIEKRGGNLVAPLPKGSIGACGYLNELSFDQMYDALTEYQAICRSYPRLGIGVEQHCEDVGLEDPSTMAQRTLVDQIQ